MDVFSQPLWISIKKGQTETAGWREEPLQGSPQGTCMLSCQIQQVFKYLYPSEQEKRAFVKKRCGSFAMAFLQVQMFCPCVVRRGFCWWYIFLTFLLLFIVPWAIKICNYLLQKWANSEFLKDFELYNCFDEKGSWRPFGFSSSAMDRNTFHQIRLSKASPTLAFNNSRDRTFTASLDSLFQCPITLIVKNFFLTSILYLPSFSLMTLPLV